MSVSVNRVPAIDVREGQVRLGFIVRLPDHVRTEWLPVYVNSRSVNNVLEPLGMCPSARDAFDKLMERVGE